MLRRHRSKHVTAPRVPLPAPTQPNERWGMDFIHDACVGGRRFRCLTMVDEFTRECPRIDVDTSLPAVRVIAAIEQLAGERGLPKSIVVDHEPEFISRALDIWAYRHGVELVFIRPGKPVENAYVESFHARFRDECLAAHRFLDLTDARLQIEHWRRDYNEVRPHSSLGNRTPSEFTEEHLQKSTTSMPYHTSATECSSILPTLDVSTSGGASEFTTNTGTLLMATHGAMIRRLVH